MALLAAALVAGAGSATCRFHATSPTVPAAAMAPPLGPVPFIAVATDEPPVVPAMADGCENPGDDALPNPAPVVPMGIPADTPSTRAMRSADARDDAEPKGARAAAS